MNTKVFFPIFMAVWIALGVGSAFFFNMNRNAALKRKIFPVFLIVTAVLFLGFAWATGALKGASLFIFGPAIILIVLLNMRLVRFCDACGSTLCNQLFLSPPKFCAKCGARLKEK